jgi:hypothetical protein
MLRKVVGLLSLALTLLVMGCGGLKFMNEAKPPQAVAADPANATVVFIRPSGYGGGASFNIIDQSGRFLGEVNGESYFVSKMPPGQYTFIAWSEGTPAMQATVEAGKVYYVEVGVTIGMWGGHARLFAIGPQREQWAKLPKWLADSTELLPKPDASSKFSADRGSDEKEVIQKGVNNYAGYEGDEKQKRTLLPSDGVSAPVTPSAG